MSSTEIGVEVTYKDEIAVVVMNRKLNVLGPSLIDALKNILGSLEKDEKVRGVILTGTGRSFIAGADIKVMRECDTNKSVEFISNLQSLMGTIRNLTKPVTAAINGFCFGAGPELVASCDLAIASEQATFGMQEVKMGMPSVIEAAIFPFIIGLNKTREILLNGEVFDSEEACKMSLVHYVVKHEELMDVAMKRTKLITQNMPHGITIQKQLINRWLENAGLELSVKAGVQFFGLAFAHRETTDALRNALKK
jgi:enoyl-CoA hydratase